MVNLVILVGNLGGDPEVRNLPSGQSVANFTLATNRKYKDSNGNKQEETEWHKVAVFGRQAEIASQYLHRGKKIYLEGRLKTRSWDDKETGQKRYATEIVCNNFQMLGSNQDGGDQQNQQQSRGGWGNNQQSGFDQSNTPDSDTPF